MGKHRRKAKRPRIRLAEVRAIVAMYLDGRPTKEIVEKTGRSCTTIYGVIKGHLTKTGEKPIVKKNFVINRDHTPRSE